MANPKYAKPPITEAIIDIRVEPRSDASAVNLVNLVLSLKNEFPNYHEIAPLEDSGIPAEVRQAMGMPLGWVLGGFQCESADKRRIVQLRREAFVYRLIGSAEFPYPGWDAFKGEAEQIWEQYKIAWHPQKIVRVAVRYVNQFILESPAVIQEVNLLLQPPRPNVVPGNPMVMMGFAAQSKLRHSNVNAESIINQGLLFPSTTQKSTAYVLDIDVYQDNLNLPPYGNDLEQRLSVLREQKNDLFQTFITDSIEESLGKVS